MTLRARLAAVVGFAIAVVLAGGWIVALVVPRAQLTQVDRQLRASAVPQAFGALGGGAPPPDGQAPGGSGPAGSAPVGSAPAGSAPVGSAQALADLSDLYVARILADGTRLALFPAPETAASRPAPIVPDVPVRPGPSEPRTVASVADGPRWRALLLRNPQGGDDALLVAVSLARADAATTQVRVALVAVGVTVVAALAVGGWWVLRLGLRPIAEVTGVADAITAGDRTRRVRVTHPRTEAGHLGHAFNVMLDERQAAEEQLRRFVADASHELRTPVAAVRGFADLYRHGHLDDPAALADAMRRIGGESARMAGLVDDLLLLARLDEGRPLERAPVDLAPLLADAALDAGATHPSRTVTVDVDGALAVVGDEARLRQVVANLVQNALVHAGPAAAVALRGRRTGDRCVVEVADDGAGLDADQAARAFDRFWRADPSRLRHANGSGLGLSIVRAIAEAHGGQVALESAPGAGTTVRIVLPAA